MIKRPPPFSGLRPLFKITTPLTKKACAKHDGFLGSLLLDWPLIVGNDLAQKAHPKKVSFPRQANNKGTITLAVASGSTSMMIYHMGPLILDKINTFFGYAAFHQIKVVQTQNPLSFPESKITAPKHSLSTQEQSKIESLTDDLPNGPLKEALKNLGEGLYLKDKHHEK